MLDVIRPSLSSLSGHAVVNLSIALATNIVGDGPRLRERLTNFCDASVARTCARTVDSFWKTCHVPRGCCCSVLPMRGRGQTAGLECAAHIFVTRQLGTERFKVTLHCSQDVGLG